MKSLFKRLLSLTLVVMMLIPMISATGLTVSAATYSGKCGDNLTWSFYADTGELIIDGTGDMYDYTSSSSVPWYTYCSSIKTVEIGNFVTSIGSSAFSHCNSLTSVTIGNSVTSIGSFAFEGCKSLTSVTIPDSVTSICQWAFSSCSSLESVTIPDSVANIDDGAFYDTAYYNNQSNWIKGVLYIGNHLIKAKSSLSGSYIIKNGTLTIASSAFQDCTSLTSVTIPDSVKSMGYWVFGDCTTLKNLIIGNSVTSIGSYAFANCTSLKSVIIPDSVTSIGYYSFGYCTSIENLIIGNSVTSIGDYAFYECYLLTSVTIGNSVTSIGSYAFDGCRSITSVTIPSSVTSIADYAFYDTAYYNNSSNWTNNVLYIGNHLIEAKDSISGACTIKDGTSCIADRSFYSCDSLTSVTIPDSVTSIGKYAFAYCDSLTSVTIPDSVTSIGNSAFYYCTSLTSVTIGNSVTSIGYRAFHYYSNGYKPLDITIKCYENSYAHTYAIDNGFKYELQCIHVFTNYVSDDNYTCTEDGTKTAYCDNGCGKTDTVIDVGSAAHRYTREEILRAPTCSKNGYKIAFCDCGAKINETIAPVDHVYTEYTYNNDATCTSDGTKTAYCDFGCGASDTRTVDGSMIGHMFVNYKYNDDAACTVDGTETAYCDNGCGASDTRTAEGSMTGHLFVDYEYNNDATCNADGTETAYCDYGCGNTDTKAAVGTKLAHSYSSAVTLEPTCTSEGVKTYTCTSCGTSYDIAMDIIPHSYTEEIFEQSTCTTLGLALYICDCGDFYTADLPVTEHPYGDWITVTAPTDSAVGEQTRECSICGEKESKEIPMLAKPEIWVDNYTITITTADNIKDLRYAPGVYTTTTEIRNAEGNVAIDNSIVKEYTIDGSFVYEMPNGGYYTVWVRMQDGRNYILPLDVTNFTPTVTANGVTVTLHDLYDVKDFYIAKGEFNTYREIKDNGYAFSATGTKIAGKHNYTCTVKEAGMHTVLIRYNDGSTVILYEELTVDEPVFTTNGLQVTISNIPDVKVIRTAYGVYNTPGEVKRADGARNFSGKSVIKGADPYKIQYREEGMVTITVEYNNGYVKVFHYEVTKKTPTVEQDGNKVVFSDLDGLVMVRYAKGVYTTSTQIKNAKGSKTLKPANIVDGKIEVSLNAGTYTFCVQYDDESFNYYVITVE